MNPKLQSILNSGLENLQIVADFDRTLICATVDGVEVPSATHILYTEKYLDDDYMTRAKDLYDFYRPIEQDNNISKDEKSKHMEDWWTKHYDLKLEKGLHIDHLEKLSNSKMLVFRKGVKEFLKVCKDKNIPIIILSSNGLGFDMIKMLLERDGMMSDNVHIHSNRTLWGEDGVTTGVAKPIVHSQNKNESVLGDITLRDNFIVIGDGLHDAEMINQKSKDGKDRQVYKIGIYEAIDDSKLEEYKKVFDDVWSSLDGEISFSKLASIL